MNELTLTMSYISGRLNLSYMDQFTVAFGVATSVVPFRNDLGATATHTNTGSKITAYIENGWKFMAVLENGQEHPITVYSDEPFVRENSIVAVTMRSGLPVVVTNVNSGMRTWVNGGPEEEFKVSQALDGQRIAGVAAVGIAIVLTLKMMVPLIYPLIIFIVGVLLLVQSFQRGKKRDALLDERDKRRADRTAHLDGEIARFKQRIDAAG